MGWCGTIKGKQALIVLVWRRIFEFQQFVNKLSTFLQLLKGTRMRSGEATKLKWIDIDEERRIVTLNAPDKGSNPRMWEASAKLHNMLNTFPKKVELVFGNPNT